MLRVFLSSKDKVSDEIFEGINIQRISLENILNDANKLRGFKKYIQKSLLEGDKVIIISFIDTYFTTIKTKEEHPKLKIINTKLPESSDHLLVNEIINNQDESLDYIEKKIKSLENVLELFFIAVMGY